MNRTLLLPTSTSNSLRSWLTRMKPSKSIETIQTVRREQKQNRKINELKSAFSELYLMLVLLKNYQSLNSSGFQKILIKHDRLFQTTRGDEWWYVYLFFSFKL